MMVKSFFRILTASLALTCLSACFVNSAGKPLTQQEEAVAQTRFILQAQTSAARYAGTRSSQSPLPGLTSTPAASDLIPTLEQEIAPVTSGTPIFPVLDASPTPTNPALVATTPIPTFPQPSGTPRAFTPTKTSALSVTPTKTPTRTLTPTITATLTPTIPTGWAGEWLITFYKTDGSTVSGILSAAVNGDSLTAQTTLDGSAYTFEGYVFPDGQVATGSWQSPSASGIFWWKAAASGQFNGCWNDRFAFCGARSGVSQPQPCLLLPPL